MPRSTEDIRREGLKALEERLGRADASRFLKIFGSSIPETDVWGNPGQREGQLRIEEKLTALASQVPESEWENLPPDLLDNIDHYVYGMPPGNSGSTILTKSPL